ncbi:MAG: hypothetical protein EBX37_17430 [Alphaproteobacteria bacterium]|nr:hypothetical protein [Alphaproteobacteria bacterium]
MTLSTLITQSLRTLKSLVPEHLDYLNLECLVDLEIQMHPEHPVLQKILLIPEDLANLVLLDFQKNLLNLVHLDLQKILLILEDLANLEHQFQYHQFLQNQFLKFHFRRDLHQKHN